MVPVPTTPTAASPGPGSLSDRAALSADAEGRSRVALPPINGFINVEHARVEEPPAHEPFSLLSASFKLLWRSRAPH